MWHFISETRTEKKIGKSKKKLVFFRNKLTSKFMKAVNYKMKQLNKFIFSSNVSPYDLQLSRICLASTKERQISQKLK